MKGIVLNVIPDTIRGYTTVVVRVDETARPDIVPGYPGCELMEVVVYCDDRIVTTHLTRGKYGYRPSMGTVRAAAVRAARKHLRG